MQTDTQTKLVSLLRNLNPDTSDDILRERALLLQLSAYAAVNDLPQARKAGRAKNTRDLHRVGRTARLLASYVRGLHAEAIQAFDECESRGELHPAMLARTLRQFAEAAERAAHALPDTPPHKGNRERLGPREVTRIACDIYKELTGKQPGRAVDSYGTGQPYGQLHEFLEAVFIALRIQATADSQLKLLLHPNGKKAQQKRR